MATKVIQSIEKDLSRQLRELEQLAREIDRTQAGSPKRPKQRKPAEFVTMPAKDATALLRQELGQSHRNLADVYGRRNGSAIYNLLVDDLERALGQDAGLRKYIETAAKVGLHLVTGIVQTSSVFLSTKQKFDIQVAMKRYVARVASAGMGPAINNLQTSTGFGADAAVAASLGLPTTTTAANPFRGNARTLLRPFNIEYLEWLDATVERKTAQLGAMQSFIANAAAQRAVVMYLPRKTPSEDVLLPQIIGGTSVAAVQRAFGDYPSKSVVGTYNYYKAAYDDYQSRERDVVTGDVTALAKSAKRALDSLPGLMRKAGYTSSAISPFSSLIRQIKISDNRDSILMAGIDVANLIGAIGSGTGGAFSGVKVLGPPLSTRTSALATAVGNEITSPASVTVNMDLMDPEAVELQAAIKPRNFASLEIADPRNAEMRNAVIRAWLDLEIAFDELVSMSFLPGPSPTGVSVAPPTSSPQFRTFARNAISDIGSAVGTQVSGAAASLPANARTALEDAIVDAANLMLDSTDVGRGDFFGAAGRNLGARASNVYLLRLASGDQVSDVSLVRGELENELNQLRVSPKNRRTAISIFENATGYMMNGLNGISVQARSIGMRLRSNPALSKLQATGVGVGSLYGTHAVTAALQGALKPTAGSGTALAADLLPTVAVGGLGAYFHYKGSEAHQGYGLPLAIGSVGHLIARYVFTRPGVRFSDNAILKGLQYAVNGPAALVGDYSMGPCTALPLDVQGKTVAEAAEMLNAALRMNKPLDAMTLATQAYMNGLTVTLLDGENVSIGVSDAINVDALNQETAQAAFANFDVYIEVAFMGAAAYQSGYEGATFTSQGLVDTELMTFLSTALDLIDVEVEQIGAAVNRVPSFVKARSIAEGTAGAETVEGFILEPGYKADLYSAEDGFQALTPPPAVNSDPGVQQLKAAMARARKLTPEEITMEGYPDLIGNAIILVDPATARAIESRGLGMSLGPSTRSNGSELVTFEVMGANTLEPIAPERQHNVPQGALGYPKIQQASSMTVSPRGAFNRGAFDPVFG